MNVELHVESYKQVSPEDIRRVCTAFFGDRARFAYDCFEWANAELFGGALPYPLITWCPTLPYGRCIGLTENLDPTVAVIRLADRNWPNLWRGALMTFDVIVHELVHVRVAQLRRAAAENIKFKSSHDNPLWCDEVNRISPLIGLDGVLASPTTRRRRGGGTYSTPREPGAAPMKKTSKWPHSFRPENWLQAGRLPTGLR